MTKIKETNIKVTKIKREAKIKIEIKIKGEKISRKTT